MSRRRLRIVAITALVCAPAVQRAPAEDAAGLPGYRFEVGQELIYRLTKSEDLHTADDEEQAQEATRLEPVYEWRVYPLRQNDDGSWRLVVRGICKILETPNVGAGFDWKATLSNLWSTGQLPKPGEPSVTFENEFLGYCDLQRDGSYAMNESLSDNSLFAFQPESLFCQLPKDKAAPAGNIRYESPASHAEFDLHIATAPDGSLQLEGPRREPLDANYQQTVTVKFTFDSRRGAPTAIVTESKSDGSESPWHTRATTELVGSRRRDDAWIAAFADESDSYFEMTRAWSEATERSYLARTKAGCTAVLDEVRELISQRREQTTLVESREIFDALLAFHDREAVWAVESAQEREAMYANPPVDWETADLDGKPARQIDYRGQVVLLDFWYRGCSYCIKAMPKIKRLAAKYEGQPVAVLGINKDRHDADARFVIDEHKLKHPTLRDRDISKAYKVSGWPTFVLLDQSGRVNLVLFGDSDYLEDTLDRAIEELLANPASADNDAARPRDIAPQSSDE